jgi:CCR4-NOT transcription complex subunit 4
MWCWHRIRESESGLCPACRTPYGEDPHQFSGMDVDEVLKANKEKEAAAKRERQRQQGDGDNSISEQSGPMEVPKDRTQLANMRVIRRNLVYAVGLPAPVATEEILRKPEYFGQYGKINKIVLNRAQVQGTDPRRATASAYVTFVHKEDTLACILALDGFYLEGRNVRASYGTSKYCSAFIKNVRCNNPECTYLHEMGAAEDTFTKQEIQAGYVTSGRDVLARQQQILAEQLRLGATGGIPRKRVGGGGPSGTGRPATNPVLPAPEYDEPQKPAAPMVPTPSGITRSLTTLTASLNPANISAKMGRSNSVAGASGKSPTLGSTAPSHATPPIPPAPGGLNRKAQSAAAPSAASIVAGSRPLKPDSSESHSTLTPLTPLKRNSKTTRAASVGQVPENSQKPAALRNNSNKKNGTKAVASLPLTHPVESVGSTASDSMNAASSIGGDVIGPPAMQPRMITAAQGLCALAPINSMDSFGGLPGSFDDELSNRNSMLGSLGGEVYEQMPIGGRLTIGGGGHDKWNDGGVAGLSLNTGSMLSSSDSGDNLWNGSVSSSPTRRAPGPNIPSPIGGSVIGGGPSGRDSTSTLASLLGINLPTGPSSLQHSPNLWGNQFEQPTGPSALSTLNDSAIPAHDAFLGGPLSNSGSSFVGGVPIGVSSMGGQAGAIGGNKSDLTLLQTLLPGVRITTGWNESRQDQLGYGPSGLGGQNMGGNWTNGLQTQGGAGMGAIGGGTIGPNQAPDNQRRQGIW